MRLKPSFLVVGGARVADNTEDPAVDINFEAPKERFERVSIALNKPFEEVRIRFVHPVYRVLLGDSMRGSIRLGLRPPARRRL